MAAPVFKTTWLDRAVGYLSPSRGVRRALARQSLHSLRDNLRKYEGASRGRLSDGWFGGGTSADREISAGQPRLRDASRDLVRNNPHAAKAVAVLANNIVGDGIVGRAAHKSEKVNKQVNEAWALFVQQCDADGQLDFYGLQTLAAREMIEGGEVVARKRLRKSSDGLNVPLQVQLQEGDLIDSLRNGPAPGTTGNYIIQGVEFDSENHRVAYWMYPVHPGSDILVPLQSLQSLRVPATDVAHLYEKQRTQVRGVPWGTPAIQDTRDLGDYELAEAVRKKTESCVVGIVTAGDDEADTSIAPRVQDARGETIEEFRPGLIAYARGGKDIKFNQPASTQSFEAYKRDKLRSIAAGWRIPYELLSGDLSGVNYSSIRTGLIEFRRMISALQKQAFIPMFCQPIWDWFIAQAYLAGKISVPSCPVTWAPPKFMAVDPLKDAAADLVEIRAGLKSLSSAIAERGGNPNEVLEEIAACNALIDRLKLVLDSDPRRMTKGGAAQAEAEQGENAPDRGEHADDDDDDDALADQLLADVIAFFGRRRSLQGLRIKN